MADINVERRRRARWPWIVGAILLLILLWFAADLIRSRAGPRLGTAPTPERRIGTELIKQL